MTNTMTGSARATGLALVVLGLAAVLFAAIPGARAQEGDAFDIQLYGGWEVPPVETSATGTANLQMNGDELAWTLTATGDEFTMAHIHYGAAGTNGPVIAVFFMDPNNPVTDVDIAGTFDSESLLGDFQDDWDAFAEAFAAGMLYVNVHSVDHPAGVLRNQIRPTFGAALSGENEVPPVETDASGTGTVAANGVSALYSLAVTGGTEEFTMAHFHLAPAGENGPVVATIFMDPDNPVESVSVTNSEITEASLQGSLAGNFGAFLTALATEQLYFNVHSVEFGPGEARGQIVHSGNVSEAAPAIPTPTPTSEVTETPEPSPTATATMAPPTATPTMFPPTLTPTATMQAPQPPNTGTGAEGGASTNVMLLVLGGLALLAGGSLVAVSRRRL